jgi:hypothetical protein
MIKRRLMAATAGIIILVQAGGCKLDYPVASKADTEPDCPGRGVIDPTELKVFIKHFQIEYRYDKPIKGSKRILAHLGYATGAELAASNSLCRPSGDSASFCFRRAELAERRGVGNGSVLLLFHRSFGGCFSIVSQSLESGGLLSETLA